MKHKFVPMKSMTMSLIGLVFLLAFSGCEKDNSPKENWSLQSLVSDANLYSVYFTSSCTGVAVGDSGMILKTTSSGNTWETIESPVKEKLNSVYFPSAAVGYIAGQEGTILKTTDGGETWAVLPAGINHQLNALFFTDPDIGYSVGYESINTDGFNNLTGTIEKTTDGGLTWTIQESGTDSPLTSLFFTDDNSGYAVGLAGVILKTIDGGGTWEKLSSGTDKTLSSVTFITGNEGFAVGGSTEANTGIILKTVNGGETWTSLSTKTVMITSVGFLDNSVGYATSFDTDLRGIILKTVNGGSSWTEEPTGLDYAYLTSSCFSAMDTGFAVGAAGTILRWSL